MSARDFRSAVETEAAHWPGARLEFGRRSKHPMVTVSYGARSRWLPLPGTPGDNGRALQIKVCELRRTLRELGAIRTPGGTNRPLATEIQCAARRSRASP